MSFALSSQYQRAFSRMGSSNISRLDYGCLSPQSTMPTVNSLIAIHSSAQWRARFNASKFSSKLMVIYFTATWCKPCRLMEPVLRELASKHTDVEFIQIDVDELMDVSRQYGIQSMPTFLLIKKGMVIDKVVGPKREELKLKINEHGASA